ncbi:putative lipopolysaccharide heptosyltransferase III [Klebsiella pneumoniae]|uniref:putative lipopolysaccharide heptosyltransferase III n=1 Tax=Klebsiella pneumoniae TaxID=573 RepID=UPI000DD431CD|nr:putative lipopolysaccharide heptosyltransferase III [Klebsiella pneumoniae]MXM06132.1 putative lipopolysaccharide heptosyltransferase III [Klebsiella pneumoniae]UNC68939.1 putative lipopolysaccharide heptosyltransferase III [Klebsiella pneumoniae]
MTPETLSRGPLNPARILVIKLRHHGDMLLITPLIHALKQQYPAASVDVLLYEETRDMLAANPDIHHIYGLDRRWKKQGKRYQLKMQWQLIQTLRQQRYDMVLNLASTQQHNQLHTVQQNLSILAPLGLQLNEAPARMGYSEADWAASRALLPEDFREHYIVIQPTSRWFFKCWREDRMSALINALSAEGYAVVLTSGPDAREKKMVDTIIAGCPQARLHSLAGQLTLRQLAAVIDHARLFIGVDSVPMHMAAALGTPLVALFGPSKLTFWRPWQAKGEVIWAGDFGPLPDPDAINTNTDERYLDLIPTDAVIAAAKKVLA